MASQPSQNPHWLSLYASNLHDWHSAKTAQGQTYFRRQGIVENLFDLDGIDFEGRADVTADIDIELKTTLDYAQLQQKILFAWAYMRHQHVLLSSKSQYVNDGPGKTWLDKCFVYHSPSNMDDMIADAAQSITFVERDYPEVDHDDFYIHVMNSARVLDETRNLSRLFVMPIKRTVQGTDRLRIILVAAHQIADGLTCFRWSNQLIHILNRTQENLREVTQSLCYSDNRLELRLPPAQESMYPTMSSKTAIARWKWLIVRILRHVQKTTPGAFQNPLSRDVPLKEADTLPKRYFKVLNYERKPPLNCYTIRADLAQRSCHNLRRLCKEAGISIGSGCFTLVGLVMMRFEEVRHPDIPLQDRLPFVGSFPVNPRPFLSGTPTTGKEESLMLAFSEGVTLPFIPSNLDLSKSFRVLGRLAHRQLRQYQKRPRSPGEVLHHGTRSPALLLPLLYLSTLERLDGKAKPSHRVGFDPQGQYPMNKRFSLATCGISSIGDRTNLISGGRFDLDNLGDKDTAADFRDISACVRARDGEFLVGAYGTKDSLHFSVSYDGSNIDPAKARQWQTMIEKILDYDMQTASHVGSDGHSKL